MESVVALRGEGGVRHDSDREPGKSGDAEKNIEDFEAGKDGHVEVEDQKLWIRELFPVGERAVPNEIIKNLASSLNVDNALGQARACVGALEQVEFVEIVFGDEDDTGCCWLLRALHTSAFRNYRR